MKKKRLIDANDVLDLFTVQAPSMTYNKMYMAVSNAPTVDAVEVVYGQWQWVDFAGNVRCTACRKVSDERYSYCPNCGAKMDGDGNG